MASGTQWRHENILLWKLSTDVWHGDLKISIKTLEDMKSEDRRLKVCQNYRLVMTNITMEFITMLFIGKHPLFRRPAMFQFACVCSPRAAYAEGMLEGIAHVNLYMFLFRIYIYIYIYIYLYIYRDIYIYLYIYIDIPHTYLMNFQDIILVYSSYWPATNWFSAVSYPMIIPPQSH